MIIRRARQDDVDSVYALICELENTGFDKVLFENIYNNNTANENIAYFIAEVDGVIIGFSSIYIQALLHHCDRVAEIQELVVSPAYRGKNTGRQLVEKMIEWSKEKSALQVEVACNKKRQQAHEFYRSNGFQGTHEKFVLKLAE